MIMQRVETSGFCVFTSYPKKMKAFWKKTAIPGYTAAFAVHRNDKIKIMMVKSHSVILYCLLERNGSSISMTFNILHYSAVLLKQTKRAVQFKRDKTHEPGTTKPPKRIHMEAMREPKASMKPMKSHTLAPEITSDDEHLRNTQLPCAGITLT